LADSYDSATMKLFEGSYMTRQFKIARSYCSELMPALYSTDTLMMRLVGILGSDLVKGAYDQKIILSQLTDLTAKREAIIEIVSRQFLRGKSDSSVANLKRVASELQGSVASVQSTIEEWMARTSDEKANVERSKQRYIKLEKWNTVI